jgi:hypothetical protein
MLMAWVAAIAAAANVVSARILAGEDLDPVGLGHEQHPDGALVELAGEVGGEGCQRDDPRGARPCRLRAASSTLATPSANHHCTVSIAALVAMPTTNTFRQPGSRPATSGISTPRGGNKARLPPICSRRASETSDALDAAQFEVSAVRRSHAPTARVGPAR